MECMNLFKLQFNISDFFIMLTNNKFADEQNFVEIPIKQNVNKPLIVDYSHHGIRNIDKSIFSLRNVVGINLFCNEIDDLDEIEFNVEYLDVGDNKLKNLPVNFACKSAINADFNNINEVNKGSDNLQRISLHCNKLKSINENVSFMSLRILDLSNNELTMLPDISKMAPILKILDLSCNKIKKIPCLPVGLSILYICQNEIEEFIGANMNLKVLDISYNKLKKIQMIPDTIITLNVSHNEIRNIDLTNLNKLKKINLTFNKLQKIPYIYNQKILELSLNYNMINDIDISLINEYTRYADFTNNQISSISENIFMMKNIRTLNIKDNFIMKLPNNIQLSQITSLNLSNNKILKFPSSLPKCLESLVIYNCSITEIPSYLSEFEEFVVLKAGNNLLQDIPFLKYLISLDISNNRFVKLPLLSSTIKDLDISMNPLKEGINDINLPFLKTLLMESTNIDTFPFNVKTLKELNISNTKLDIDINYFHSLRYLDISNSFTSIQNKYKYNFIVINEKEENWESYFFYKHEYSLSYNRIIRNNLFNYYFIFDESDPLYLKLNELKNHDYKSIEHFFHDNSNVFPYVGLFLNENSIKSVIFGKGEIIIVYMNGNIVVQHKNFKNNLTNHFVFKESFPTINEIPINNNIKWIFIANDKLTDIYLNKISEVKSNSPPMNISVIGIDVNLFIKNKYKNITI